MSESLTEAQFNRLSRTVLNNASASARKEALLEIRKLDHDGLDELFRQVADSDKDQEVRDLAQNLLRKYEIDQALKRGSFEESTPLTVPVPEPKSTTNSEPDWLQRDYPSEPKPPSIGELLESPRTGMWTCRFCGTENTGGEKCASCGAERSREQVVKEAAPRKRKPLDDVRGDLSGVFLLQPSNMNYLLGKTNVGTALSGMSAGCATLFMLPFLAVGILVIVLAAVEWRNYHILNTTGQVVQGRYTNKYITTDDDDGGTNYHVEYTYEVNERLLSGSETVSQDIYNRAGKGEGVGILYAPSDPGLSTIEGTNNMGTPIFLTVFAIFWNLVSWGIFLVTVASAYSDRQLKRTGQLVHGELRNITTRRDSDGDLQVTVEYRFVPPDGGDPIIKKQTAQRNDLKNASLPDKGTPVMVMYKNRRHFKML